MQATYWRDARVLNPDLVERIVSSMTLPEFRAFLVATFRQILDPEALREYVRVTLTHSLKHAVRHLFVTEGSTA